jgi:hypothetical protein
MNKNSISASVPLSSGLPGRDRWHLRVTRARCTSFLGCGSLLGVLFFTSALSHAQTGTLLLGTQTVASQVDSDSIGQAEAFQATAAASGTLASLNVYLDGSFTGKTVFVGVYTSYNSHPKTLLTQASSSSLKAGAWNSISVPPVAITSGTYYWIALLGIKGGLTSFRDSSAGSCVSETSAQTSLTSLPATWSIGTDWPGSCPLSGYGMSQGTAQGTLSATPTSLSFGNVTVGSSSSPQTVTLTNTGTASVTVSQATVTGAGFAISGLSVPATLAAGQSTSFTATFAPTAAGSISGSISLISNAPGSPNTVTLSGTGVTLQLAASPASIGFGSVTVGSSSSQVVTLTNSGTASVTVTQANINGTGFSASGLTLPLTVAVGKAATFNAAFAPTATGSVTGSLSVVSNATNSPAVIALSGTGVTLNLAASPASLSFGSVNVGSTSPPQTVTLTNTGTASVTISQANVSGTGFAVSGLSMPVTLAAAQSTSFTSTFTPKAAGTASGSISVVSNASNSPASVALSGTGNGGQLAVSPTSTNFGNTLVGSNSTLPVSLQNTGTSSATLSQATVSGTGFSISGLAVPLTLAAGQSMSFSVNFDPTATGSMTGSVSLVSNAVNSPTMEALSGTGVNSHSVALSWTGSTSPNVAGYNIYSGSVSGGPYTKLNSSLVAGTSYSDQTVQAGQTYYFVATAVDSNNNESTYSNQAQAVVPTP